MAIAGSYIVFENNRPKRNFYSIERTGYLNVNDLLSDFVNDGILQSAFTVANVVITESFNVNANVQSYFPTRYDHALGPGVWPPNERLRKIVNPGAGYSVGDNLYYFVNGAKANVQIYVTAVDSETGGITDFSVMHPGVYTTPATNNMTLAFKPKKNKFQPYVIGVDISYQTADGKALRAASAAASTGGNALIFMGSVVNSTGTGGPTVVPPFQGVAYSYYQQGTTNGFEANVRDSAYTQATRSFSITAPNNITADPWETAFGPEGQGGAGNIFTTFTLPTSPSSFKYLDFQDEWTNKTGTRWPTDGIWCNVDIFTNKTLFAGQELVLVSGSPTSNIPTGTIITKLDTFECVAYRIEKSTNGGSGSGSWTRKDYYEQTRNYIYFETSNPITVNKGDRFAVKGAGAVMSDTESRTAERFSSIINVGGRIDPLNDVNGVTGVVQAVESGNTANLRIVNLSTINNYAPKLYEGQSIVIQTQGSTPTTIIGNAVISKVANLNVDNNTANITLSSTQSPNLVGATVRLYFPFNQPWRLAFEANGRQTMNAYAATSVQLKDDGTIARITDFNGNVTDRAGMMGALPSIIYTANTGTTKGNVITDVGIDTANIYQGFVNRSIRVANYPEAYPLSYIATFTDRGLFFGVWEGTWSVMQKSRSRQLSERDAWFNWFLVQRPVDRKTGQTRTTGQSPVFCINSVGYKYWKFVVRERDVMHPTQGDKETQSYNFQANTGNVFLETTQYRVPADRHSEDSHMLLNTTDQIALTEDSKYLVSFLYNLTTPRFRYSDELDMIGQTAGDVAMASSDIKIRAYGEDADRTYKSLAANLPYNAGLRICVLKDLYQN